MKVKLIVGSEDEGFMFPSGEWSKNLPFTHWQKLPPKEQIKIPTIQELMNDLDILEKKFDKAKVEIFTKGMKEIRTVIKEKEGTTGTTLPADGDELEDKHVNENKDKTSGD